MMPKTIQDCFRKLTRVLLGGGRGPQQVSTCGGSGGTALKAALWAEWAPEARWVGGMVVKAFAQANLRAEHFSKRLPGAERWEPSPSAAWPWMPGQHRAAVSDLLYTSLALRAGADVRSACTCVYFYGQAPELSTDSQSKKMLTTTTLSSNCKFLNLRTQDFLLHSPSDHKLLHKNCPVPHSLL